MVNPDPNSNSNSNPQVENNQVESKTFKFIIEHMEPEISEWVSIEYKNMILNVGENNLILTGLQKQLLESSSSLKGAELRMDSVEDWPSEIQNRIVLLDPKASQELSPSDGTHFDYLLFGGILGDDPPRDRTGMLRKMGFATRHLGPVQMTTDTAVIVANQVVTYQRPLDSIEFIDHPDVVLSKRESISLPFRFVSSKDERLGLGLGSGGGDGKVTPILAPGLVEHLRAQNNESIF